MDVFVEALPMKDFQSATLICKRVKDYIFVSGEML